MNKKLQLIIASLLYDIGKLGYRAGVKGTHEEIGRSLVEEYKDYLSQEVASLISLHHQKNLEDIFSKGGYLPLKKLIIADWLTSSERIGIDQVTDVRDVGLSSIFSKISIFQSQPNKNYQYLGRQLAFANGSEEIFPENEIKVSKVIAQNIADNWESFKRSFNRVKQYSDDPKHIFEFLLSLLKKHFKFIPSAAYRVEPDISLFDHSKMVCALAVSLHNYFTLNSINEEQEVTILNLMGQILRDLYLQGDSFISEIKKDPKKKEVYESTTYISLIHGDFSGIQKFIHLISSKYAMKTLKGRSFFFSLLTENIASYIVDQLDLTQANIIYAGGGHFYIISHYTDDLDFQISNITIKVNKLFIEHFNSNLYLALDHVPLSIEKLIYNISDMWKEINIKTSQKKKKKFSDIIKNLKTHYFEEIFGPILGSALKRERCAVCNSFEHLEPMPDSDDIWCIMCKSFKELTDDVKLSQYYKIVHTGLESYNTILNEFEKAVSFVKAIESNQLEWYSINDLSSKITIGDKQLPIAFPLEKGKITDNDELAKKAQKRTGYNKLGILKMDVDSLGQIFQKGLKDNSTISRVSTLSSSLTLFFEGYIPKLIQTEFSDSVYLIFSGGDDLFAIGAWDHIIEFAYILYKDFRKFTAFNPDITLSAGIVIDTPTFPIIKASIAAEDELERAKSYEPFTGKTNTKNKISIFGSILKWDWSFEKDMRYSKFKQDFKEIRKYHRDQIITIMKQDNEETIINNIFEWVNEKSEFELAYILKDLLVYLIKGKDFSKSMLHKLGNSILGLRTILEDSLERRIRVPKLWRLKYYLRTVLRSMDPEVKLMTNFIVSMIEIVIKNNLFKSDSSLQIKNVEFISVAIKWADYLTRL